MPTKIEWASETWNPVTGCSPVSAGCQHCYAARFAKRFAGRFGYQKDEPFAVTFHRDKLNAPLRWRRPRRVFVCSMGDIFHPDVKPDWLEKIAKVMKQNTRHTFYLLTKRPGNIPSFFDDIKNVWLGVSVECKEEQRRLSTLAALTDSPRLFMSAEPLLGELRLPLHLLQGARWIICGGETGPGARRMNLDWARSLRDDCKTVGVPFFFKQAGTGQATPADLKIREWPR